MSFNISPLLFAVWVAVFCANLRGAAQNAMGNPTKVDVPVELIDTRSGLSQGLTSEILQDASGYLWIATKDGLNRYDGYQFKVYRHNPNNPNSLSGNTINFMAMGIDGRIWIATNSDGLDLFDPKTEKFTHFNYTEGCTNCIRSNWTGMIGVFPDGKVVVETGEDDQWDVLIPDSRWRPTHEQGYEVRKMEEVFPGLKSRGSQKKRQRALQPDRDGGLWIQSGDSVHHYTAMALAGKENPVSFIVSNSTMTETIAVRRRYFDHSFQGRVCVVSGDKVLGLDHQAKKTETLFALGPGQSFGFIYTITSGGHLWARLEDSSVVRINLHTQSMQQVHFRSGEEVVPALNESWYIKEDSRHNFWIGTMGFGFLKISETARFFKSIPADGEAQSKSMWLQRTAWPGKKAVFDPESKRLWKELFPKLELPEEGMIFQGLRSHLTRDKQGHFWVLTQVPDPDKPEMAKHCLVEVDPTENRAAVRMQLDGLGKSWTGVPIIPGIEGDIWFGDAYDRDSFYFHRLHLPERRLEQYAFPVAASSIGYQMVSDWVQDKNGNFWLGTMKGLFFFSPSTKKWRHYANQPGNHTSLSENVIFSVEEDALEPDRYLWVGTNGGGLNRLEIDEDKFLKFDMEDGLPNNVVYGIRFDSQGNLWLSTNNGLCLFDRDKHTTRNFDSGDGLVTNEFNRYEFSASEEGELWFGGVKGVVHFHPSDFYQGQSGANVEINAIQLMDQELEVVSGRIFEPAGTNAGLARKEEIVLDHDFTMLTLRFALLDLTAPKKNIFRYRLLGFNDNWIESGTKNEATYTNLGAGSYTFEVIGSHTGDAWSPEPARLSIVVLPPWWEKWWFRTLVVLLALALVYFFARTRINNLLHIERLRNRIGQDLHDEIGSTLSSIALYGAVLKNTSADLPGQSVAIIDKIIGSSSQAMESMNDMVWTIKASNDNFEEVVNRMRAFAVNVTEAKNIELEMEVSPVVEKLKVGMERRKNIYLIFKEAVNNAAKYSACTVLAIKIEKSGSQLILSIRDNGRGFDLENAGNGQGILGGNGLRGMRMRAEEMGAQLGIDTRKGGGTRISCSIPLH